MSALSVRAPRALAVRTWLTSPVLWIAAGILLTLSLRLPYFDAALGRDEGGDTMVALAWSHSSPFAYGPYFLDRPPLLMALFRLAAKADGVTGVRALGALASASAVALSTLLAALVGGRRAAPFAALAAGAMMSSLAAMAVYTPAELIAIVPSAASILLLVAGLRRPAPSLRLLAGAGAAAALAVLVKQSFGDALVAGAAALLITRRRRGLGAYAGGVAAVVLALAAWAAIAGASAHQVWYAIGGFRLDSAHALANGNAEGRLSRLDGPTLKSGLAVALVFAAAGIATLRARPGIRPALAVWLAAGLAGVILSGSYWPHYVIELMPVAAVGSALLLSRRPALGALGLCVLVLPVMLATLSPGIRDRADGYQRAAVTLGHYVHLRAEPGQTAYVLYARVNALYYTGLPSPFPYHWSLMMRSIPGAPQRLRALLASPRRPTWIIDQDGPRGYGLDPGGATGRLLTAHYRRVAHVCGRPILLARGAPAKPPPPMTSRCELSRSVLPAPA